MLGAQSGAHQQQGCEGAGAREKRGSERVWRFRAVAAIVLDNRRANTSVERHDISAAGTAGRTWYGNCGAGAQRMILVARHDQLNGFFAPRA
jgi:hypothetical protein